MMKKLLIACSLGLSLGVVPVSAPVSAQAFRAPPVQVAEPGPTGRRVTDEGLIANYFPAAGRAPGVLLLGGSEGGLGEGVKQMALLLQQQGYSVLQLSFFRSPGQSPRLERVPLEYFGKAIDWLKRQAEVDPRRVAVLGGSKGAEAALLVASRRSDVRAVVAAMPSNVVWPGVDWEAPGGDIGSSWAERGRPLPHLPFGRPETPPANIAAVHSAGLAQLGAHPAAAIPVERIRGPILLVCGEADTLWPSCPMARQVQARAARRRASRVTLLAYNDAGHAVLGAPLAAGNPRLQGLAALGGSPEGNNSARADAWPKIVDFLKATLGRGYVQRSDPR
jgi:dienelactone hydrolase